MLSSMIYTLLLQMKFIFHTHKKQAENIIKRILKVFFPQRTSNAIAGKANGQTNRKTTDKQIQRDTPKQEPSPNLA